MTTYAVIPAEGHYGDYAIVVSTHTALAAAKRAAKGRWQVIEAMGEAKGSRVHRTDVQTRAPRKGDEK